MEESENTPRCWHSRDDLETGRFSIQFAPPDSWTAMFESRNLVVRKSAQTEHTARARVAELERVLLEIKLQTATTYAALSALSIDSRRAVETTGIGYLMPDLLPENPMNRRRRGT